MALVQGGVKIAKLQITLDIMFADPRRHHVNSGHTGLPCQIRIMLVKLVADMMKIIRPALA